ncbi:hypothetical protein CONLIGDRAFT_342876 [Coniochaeta ligniaria NRRL 30616]|uniref:Uncharacterized protein n=1 Tax=Coniochaeta ligniaria NRRL 30616 TaxID=1408157 RepID=A0A1J7JIW0_9PEZI|nr:hypothetical protein CONLIGDRAFT_342876 [Coniochaeta ligniaria NRRL 30616]
MPFPILSLSLFRILLSLSSFRLNRTQPAPIVIHGGGSVLGKRTGRPGTSRSPCSPHSHEPAYQNVPRAFPPSNRMMVRSAAANNRHGILRVFMISDTTSAESNNVALPIKLETFPNSNRNLGRQKRIIPLLDPRSNPAAVPNFSSLGTNTTSRRTSLGKVLATPAHPR